MPDGIRHEFLRAPKERVRLRAVVDAQPLGPFHVNVGRGDVANEAGQVSGKIRIEVVRHRVHEPPDVSKEEARQGLSRPNALAGFSLGLVRGDFEVQREGGQVVAQHVVQLPGDSQPLLEAAPLRQTRLHAEREEREELEADVGRHEHESRTPRPVKCDSRADGERLREEPEKTGSQSGHAAELGGYDDEEDNPLESEESEGDVGADI